MTQHGSCSMTTPVMTPAMHPYAWKHGRRPTPVPQNAAPAEVRRLPAETGLVRAAEREMTVAWGWVLVGTALSQVIGAPIAAGGDPQRLQKSPRQEGPCINGPSCCT